MNNLEFFKLCQAHDWFYDYSDDHRVWRKGNEAYKALTDAARNDPIKLAIFNAWSLYHFTGSSFGTPQAPKPTMDGFVD